jgi:hypothetical protein
MLYYKVKAMQNSVEPMKHKTWVNFGGLKLKNVNFF